MGKVLWLEQDREPFLKGTLVDQELVLDYLKKKYLAPINVLQGKARVGCPSQIGGMSIVEIFVGKDEG